MWDVRGYLPGALGRLIDPPAQAFEHRQLCLPLSGVRRPEVLVALLVVIPLPCLGKALVKTVTSSTIFTGLFGGLANPFSFNTHFLLHDSCKIALKLLILLPRVVSVLN